jgi:methylmalonyl-CoA mutase N-terminal domain/subunit
MAAVLGGAQSLHTNSLDEAFALPSEHAATVALRTQQVIAYESGVADVPDPFGGSEYIERLTLELEQAALDYMRRIDEMGGMIPAIEQGFPQREIASASYQFQKDVEAGRQIVVGVNRFQTDTQHEAPLELLRIDRSIGEQQIRRLEALRRRRDSALVEGALDKLRCIAASTLNTMPCILEAVRAYATLGEICNALRDVFGSYQETSVL